MSIDITAPINVVAGKSFSVTGALAGYLATPTLVYSDHATLAVPVVTGVEASALTNEVTVRFAAATPVITAPSWNTLPAGASVSTTGFAFTHPGLTAGQHALAVADNANHTIAGYIMITVASAPPFAESSEGATVELPKTITGSDGTKWSLTDTGIVTVNGVPDATTYNAVSLYYDRPNHRLYHKNTTGQWWYKVKPGDKSWTQGAAPAGAK